MTHHHNDRPGLQLQGRQRAPRRHGRHFLAVFRRRDANAREQARDAQGAATAAAAAAAQPAAAAGGASAGQYGSIRFHHHHAAFAILNKLSKRRA